MQFLQRVVMQLAHLRLILLRNNSFGTLTKRPFSSERRIPREIFSEYLLISVFSSAAPFLRLYSSLQADIIMV